MKRQGAQALFRLAASNTRHVQSAVVSTRQHKTFAAQTATKPLEDRAMSTAKTKHISMFYDPRIKTYRGYRRDNDTYMWGSSCSEVRSQLEANEGIEADGRTTKMLKGVDDRLVI